jgi:hypothetical protein
LANGVKLKLLDNPFGLFPLALYAHRPAQPLGKLRSYLV